MKKITIIGAGGYVFPLRLTGDILSFPALRDSTITLMDVDLERLEGTADAARQLVEHHGLPATIESTTDRREALQDADYVILTFLIGGTDTYATEMEISRKYGIDQAVGDTLGATGVFRFLRTAPVLAEIAADMRELCPGAQMLNYVNPMAMNCWFLADQGIRVVGLCHSVQGTSHMLARQLDVPYDEVSYRVGGINHQAWFTEFRRGDEDLLPRIRDEMPRRHIDEARARALLDDGASHSEVRGDSLYEGAQERVRSEILRAFGYFQTESSHHASEYLPWFRKDDERIREFTPTRWGWQPGQNRDGRDRNAELLPKLLDKLEPSVEYGAVIINAMETDQPAVIYGNVPNDGLIPNLPQDCCVEVACLVDRNGIQPTTFGELPPQCAAVNQTNVNVQRLAVLAARTGNREHVYHAAMLDPLTGALLTLEQTRSLVDELFAAEADWLPQFTDGSGTASPATELVASAG
ncbi:MAG TPA: alpha-glucosidase/alpha-galactosidase [Thermomicrobiales bacterium]|jgi:alpha-galactosidase|nr:alpha-glucosidase/alpha-galactosidase [Thermomicrobiales bacterium]